MAVDFYKWMVVHVVILEQVFGKWAGPAIKVSLNLLLPTYVSSSHKMDSCAIKKDENLLDAADIEWFNDADDAHLLPPTSSEVSRWSRDSVPIAVPEVLRGLLPSIEHPDSCS